MTDGTSAPIRKPESAAPALTLRALAADDDAFVRRLYRSTREDLAAVAGVGGHRGRSLLDLQFEAQGLQYARSYPMASDDIVLLGTKAVGRLRVNRAERSYRVVDIALVPEVRGMGIGTTLLQSVQREAVEAGAALRLHVQRHSRAETLYRRLGFRPLTDDRPDGEDRGTVDVEMEWVAEQWLPIHLLPHRPSPLVEWFDAGELRLVDPFFVQTYQRAEDRARRSGKPWRRIAPIEELMADAADSPGLEPAGFVFHMSRCGSTLVSQMLAADPDNVVLSEPPALDALLRNLPTTANNEAQATAWLRALVSVLGRPRHGERRLFVKFDAWHTTALPLLRRAFPATPFVFLFRDPLEVLVSQERMTGAFFAPGGAPSTAFGLDLAEAVSMGPEDFQATVLTAICRAALHGIDDGGFLVDYQDLPSALREILAHFGIAVTAERLALMEAVAQWDAKAPQRRFVPDAKSKHEQAMPSLRRAASLMDGVWAELRAARVRQISCRERQMGSFGLASVGAGREVAP